MQNAAAYYATVAELYKLQSAAEMYANVQRIARETGLAAGVDALVGLSDDECEQLVQEALVEQKEGGGLYD